MLKTAVPVPEYLLLSEPLFHARQRTGARAGRRIEDELAGLGPTAACTWSTSARSPRRFRRGLA